MEALQLYPLLYKSFLDYNFQNESHKPHPDILFSWVGGIDFLYQLTQSKRNGIQFQLQTALHSLHFLGDMLDVQGVHVYNMRDLASSIALVLERRARVIAMVSTPQGRFFYHVEHLKGNELTLSGQRYSLKVLQEQWSGVVLYVLRNPQKNDAHTLTKMALLKIADSFRSVDGGALRQLRRWQLLLRRPSMRNNWIKLLKQPRNYFLLATQLYQYLSRPLGAHREQFANCVSQSALFLKQSALTHSAQLFRNSAQQWQRLSEILIAVEECELQDALKAI